MKASSCTVRRQIAMLLLLLPACVLLGCGSNEQVQEYESYFREVIAETRSLTTTLQGVQSREAAMNQIEPLGRMTQQLQMKLAESAKLPDVGTLAGATLKSRFQESWQGEMEAAFTDLQKEAQRLDKEYGSIPAIKRVAQRLQNLERQIVEFKEGYEQALGE